MAPHGVHYLVLGAQRAHLRRDSAPNSSAAPSSYDRNDICHLAIRRARGILHRSDGYCIALSFRHNGGRTSS